MKISKVKVGLTLFLISLLWLIIIESIQAMTVNPDINFQVQNELYTTNHTMSFNRVIVSDTWICFNNTSFNITSDNPITIVLSYLRGDIDTASNGDIILSFNATSIDGIVEFEVSGFIATGNYSVYRDNVLVSDLVSNTFGKISFSNGVWSTKSFDVLKSNDSIITEEVPEEVPDNSESGSAGSAEDLDLQDENDVDTPGDSLPVTEEEDLTSLYGLLGIILVVIFFVIILLLI